MKRVSLQYKAIISECVAVYATGVFKEHEDEWELLYLDDLDAVRLTCQGESHSLTTWGDVDGTWFRELWTIEVKQLLKENDADLMHLLSKQDEMEVE